MHPLLAPDSHQSRFRTLSGAAWLGAVVGIAAGVLLGLDVEDGASAAAPISEGSSPRGDPADANRHAVAARADEHSAAAVAEIAVAARAWLASLDAAQRAIAAKPFEDPARLDWHFVPRSHDGLELLAMNEAQRRSAVELMRRTLSLEGATTIESIIALEAVLHELEKGRGPRRDPLGYAFAVFGTPGTTPWGFEVEGHHLSLNFTFTDAGISATPRFLGANPASVREGPQKGTRALGFFEDSGRGLVRSLDDAQRAAAVISERAPADILAVPGRTPEEIAGLDDSGLVIVSLREDQRTMVMALIERFARVLHGPLADAELARVMQSPHESIRFAWMGGLEPGEGHYYRIVGPTFLIEYDNTQNGANHIHLVWRDRSRDFGADLLVAHLESAHEDRPGSGSEIGER